MGSMVSGHFFCVIADSDIKSSGVFHSSETEILPHWTLRGFDQTGIARITYHVFPSGTDISHLFLNGGSYWEGRQLRSWQCRRV